MTKPAPSFLSKFHQILNAATDITDIASAQILARSLSDRKIHDAFIKKLPNPTMLWAKNAPLNELFAVLAARTAIGKALSGDLLAAATKRLIQSELAPGGPYAAEENHDNLSANIFICLFLENLGTHLPKLHEYIAKYADTSLASFCAYQASIGHHANPPTPLTAITAQLATKQQPFALGESNDTLLIDKKYSYLNRIAECYINELAEPIRASAEQLQKRVLKADVTHEILLLPYLFSQHIPSAASSSDIANMCIANLFCWMGYTAIDGVLDDMQVHQLPLAMTMISLCKQRYAELDCKTQSTKDFHSTFLLMDQANSLELNRRAKISDATIILPPTDFHDAWLDIGAKSCGHILGPLTILQNTSLNKVERQAAQQALRSYLIARQLQDDLYDWREDLQSGQFSYVVYLLLKDSRIQPGEYDLSALLAQLEVTFWQKGLVNIATIIQNHTSTTRQFFERHPSQSEITLITLVDRIEHSVQQAIHTNRNQKMFLDSFTQWASE